MPRTSSTSTSRALMSSASSAMRWASARAAGFSFGFSRMKSAWARPLRGRFRGGGRLLAMGLSRGSLAHLPVAVDDVLLRGQLAQAHRAEGVQAGGGDAELGAEAELASVVEAG